MSRTTRPGALSAPENWRLFLIAGAAVAIPALTYAAFATQHIFGSRLLYDTYDLVVYFQSSQWVEKGRLYRDVPSEYPLAANLIFAAARSLANALPLAMSEFGKFSMTWVALAFPIYLCALYYVTGQTSVMGLLCWLAPGCIMMSLFRFDIYPAVATLLALEFVRRNRYFMSAAWLGVAIAFKGYALFMLPAYCVFVLYRRNFLTAAAVGAVAVAPMLANLICVFLFAGWEGMLAPFSFHANRPLNGETTYDAINYILGTSPIPSGGTTNRVAAVLQIGSALAAASMRPRTFEDLVDALTFATLGFMSFSVFYSPQFVVWLLPLVIFSANRKLLVTAAMFSWMTYLYFPIAYDRMESHPGFFHAIIVAITALRLLMMALIIKQHRP